MSMYSFNFHLENTLSNVCDIVKSIRLSCCVTLMRSHVSISHIFIGCKSYSTYLFMFMIIDNSCL